MTVAGVCAVVSVLIACASGAAAPRAASPLRRMSDIDGQIVGGRDARVGEFPHQASMQIVQQGFLWYDGDPMHICGGTLIDPRWVLTAAHCVVGVPFGTRRVEVVLGVTDIDPDGAPQAGSQRRIVDKLIAHQGYNKSFNHGVGANDIGLLRLDMLAQITDFVRFARLPDWEHVPSGEAILSGWGSTSRDSQHRVFPYHLQTANFSIIDFETCYQFLNGIKPDVDVNPLVDTNVCTGPLDSPGLSACSGDSGGPLIQKDDDGAAVIVGVVSWGLVDCGSRGYPSVFTRTSAFLDWIINETSHA